MKRKEKKKDVRKRGYKPHEKITLYGARHKVTEAEVGGAGVVRSDRRGQRI